MSLEVCRVCNGTEKLKNVLGNSYLQEQLLVCVNITVNSDDLMPKQLCEKCELALEFSYRLRKKAEATETNLRHSLAVQSQSGAATLIKGYGHTMELKGMQAQCAGASAEEPSVVTLEVPDSTSGEAELDESSDMTSSEFEYITEEEISEDEQTIPLSTLSNVTYLQDERGDDKFTVSQENEYIELLENFSEEHIELTQPEEVVELIDSQTDAQELNDLDATITEEYSIDVLNEKLETPEELTEKHDKEPIALIACYICATCGMVFNNQREHRQHIKEHGDKRFNCIQCNKWFPTISRLQNHELCHQSNIELHKCSHCAQAYRTHSNLLRHIRATHEQHRLYMCTQCNETFGRSDVLKNHMLTHIEERTFKCTKCKSSFKSQRYLDSHMKTHQPRPSKRHTNSHGKAAQVRSVRANDKKTYQCNHCGKISNHHFTHKNHLRTHTKERPYKCETCAKGFCTKAAMLTHARIHTNARPYKCEYCAHSFRQPSHLKEHRMTHKGEAPHVCNTCGKSFTKKSNMLVHMRVHSGEKPYACAVCGLEFKKLALLRRHDKVEHSNTDFAELTKKEDRAKLSCESNALNSEDLELDVGVNHLADIDVGIPEIDQDCVDTLSNVQFCEVLNNANIETADDTIVFVVNDFSSIYD